MDESDIAYYRRRLSEEEELAAGTACPATRSAHLKLARLYREYIEGVTRTSRAQIPAEDVERVNFP